jgi:endonuclease/exonuclease/phosphatase family metal-dependent hydrolase
LSGEPIRVATYNIRAGIGPGEPFPPAWWRHVSRDRLQRLGAVIADLDADVVSLQEVSIFDVDGVLVDEPALLAEAAGMTVRYAAAGHFPVVEPEEGRVSGTALWGNAVLSRLPIVSSWAAGLPLGADDDLVELAGALDAFSGEPHPLAGMRYAQAPTGAREPRCVLRVTVEAGAGPLHVLSTHFTHVGGEQRRSQAAFVAHVAAALEGPLVVAGDLNATIDSPVLQPLAEALDDAFTATGTPPGDAARLSCGPMAIDHILARRLRAVECRVVRDAGDASDHWPVLATLA